MTTQVLENQVATKLEEEFIKLVKECREKRSNRLIFNASIAHAKIIFRELLDCAREMKEPVRIISGNLSKDFYNDLVDKISGLDIRVLVVDSEFSRQGNSFANAVPVKQIPHSTPHRTPHFILVGTDKFRLETDHSQAKAVASFNNHEVGKVLAQVFQELDSSSP